jgi:hypothetical protein
MRIIQALLALFCATLFAAAPAFAGDFDSGSQIYGAQYIPVKSGTGITVTICGPWNNWCAPKKQKCGKWNNWCGQANKGSQKCGKWNNWCGQANKGNQKCGKWNNWCGQADKGSQKCGKWNNWCKDPETGADTRGKKDDPKGTKTTNADQTCGKGGSCKDPETGADTRGKQGN